MIEQKSNKSKIIWVVLMIIIVGGLICGGFFIYRQQIATTEKAVSSPTPLLSNSPGKVSSINNPNGPYYHQIYAATSSDGLTWQKQGKMLFDHASVPGAVVKNNKIYLYFVDASFDEDQLSVVTSTDNGQTFTEKQKVTVQDTPSYAIVDPHPQLVDGKIRLYYFSSPVAPGEEKEPTSYQIYSASSNDGVNFDNPQVAFSNQQIITDPDVFQTDTDWRMFVSEGTQLLLAISTDGGLTFQQDENFSWDKGGVCDTIKMGGVFRTYFCGQGGILSATGAETGKLIQETGVRLESENDQIICDPSVVQLPDGSYLMFYKTQKANKNLPQ